jgi:hypothetical protein
MSFADITNGIKKVFKYLENKNKYHNFAEKFLNYAID